MFFTNKISFLFLLLFLSSVIFSQTKVIPYQELPTSSGATTGSGIFLSASMNPTIITLTFEGPADRWIALGLGTAMYITDVLIYSNGQFGATHPLSWKDYFITSHNGSGVTNDASQDWNIVSTATVAGQRTVTATRLLNTGDPDDIAVSYTASALNVVWSKGAIADYTIAYHGSSNRANGITLPWLSAPTASFSIASTTVCAGSSVTFTNHSQGGQTTYTWAFSSGSPATSTNTNPVVTYTSPGTYSVSLIAANAVGTNTLTQINYITITPTVVPSLVIGLTGGANPICAGSLATFSASAINGGSNPSYQWKVNGSNVGTNSPAFSSSTLTNTAIISCVLNSNFTCATPTTVTSSVITMTVNSSAPASVSVALNSGSNPMCNGSLAGFTATPGNGGISPAYQWQINGLNAGTNLPAFTTTGLSNGDVVSCILNSNASCASSLTGTSSGITMTVSSVLIPSVTINQSTGTNPFCAGASISFQANPVNGGSAPFYQWKINGLNAGNNSPVFTSATLNNGDQVTCMLGSSSSCASPTVALSAVSQMSVTPIPPTPLILPSGTITVCSGGSVTLSSSLTSGNLWSNGTTSQSITVSTASIFTLIQTQNGCPSLPSAPVTTTLYTIAHASLQPFVYFCSDSEPFALLGSPAGGTYSGPGVSGGAFYPPGHVGLNFIVYTYSQSFGSTTCSDTAAINLLVVECTGIKENNSTGSISVFPNPGKGEFTIRTTSEKIKHLKVIDLNGKEILNLNVSSDKTFTFDLSNYTSGIYTLEVQLESKVVRSRIQKTD